MSEDSTSRPLLRRLEALLIAVIASQRSLGFPFRFEALVPLTVGLFIFGGRFFALPPGPLCDEGMVLFLEGGCDWGVSNMFFFAKLSLLVVVNLAWITSWRCKALPRYEFWPHLLLLALMTIAFRSGGRCDSYYSHPNGSIGQMTLELACFSILGLALRRLLARAGVTTRAFALVSWNGIHVGLFYLWLVITPHWEWRHTWLLGSSLLVAALVVERAVASTPRWDGLPASSSVGAVSLTWRDAVSAIAMGTIFGSVLNPWGLGLFIGLCGAIGLITACVAGQIFGGRTACTIACAAMLIPPACGLGYGAVEHAERKRSCQRLHGQAGILSLEEADAFRSEGLRLLEELGTDARIDLASLNPDVRRVAERAIAHPSPLSQNEEIRILVPLDSSRYFFLWRNSHFTYCDIRALAGKTFEIIGKDFINELLTAEEAHTVPLLQFATDLGLRWSSPDFYSGWVLRDEEGRPRALFIAGA